MQTNQFVVVVIVVVALGLMGYITTSGSALDLGGPFRSLALARAARRLGRKRPLPQTVERTYWRAGEYVRDSKRILALGYRATSETVTDPFIRYTVPGRGGRLSGRVIRRRVPMYHVVYELQSGLAKHL
jgi:hypothetical protein